MTYTIVIREQPDSSAVVAAWHQDEMPAFETRVFPTLEAAQASIGGVWDAPGEDDDGDTLAVQCYPS